MKNSHQLSRIDKIVMDIIWEKKSATNAQILNELNDPNLTRHYIKTYLSRLRKAGLIEIKQLGPKEFVYYPLVSKEEYLADQTSNYLRDNYIDLSYMIAGLVKNEKITMEEIDRLEQFIKQYKEHNNE